MMRRVALLALVIVATACGSDGGDGSKATTTVVTAVTTDVATTDSVPSPPATDAPDVVLDADAPDFGRVVALAEEFILADLMTLGIEPIASSASVDTVGFQGMDGFDTSGIEVLPMTTLSLEYLASLQPDTIITLQFWVDQVGAELLDGIADVIIVPDGLYGVERITTMGELLGRPEHATKAIADYEAALAAAADRIPDDCTVSLAAIYPGPSVAAFVAGPWDLPSSILAAGCALDPSAADAEPDGNGRVWLSLEQLTVLDSTTLVLLQSDTVEGESDAVSEIEANALWPTLPAVASDHVIVMDRLGYMGLQGQIRFLDEFASLLEANS